MESQESDICPPEEMEMILGEPGLVPLIAEVGDWSNVPVPPTEMAALYPTGELPARSEWPGIHLFDAKVDLTGMHKKHYVVSTKLNKLFTDMDKVVPFQIKWDGTHGLYVRALMMFNVADAMKQPVRRCVAHRDKDHSSNARYNHWDHVLATENNHAQYFIDEVSNRHSVLVPLHLQEGCDHALINYKFMCKTSCSGGLNRSPTDVIFTLEDALGNVVGRQKIGVKICSCPKRDKEKEEENLHDPSGSGKRKTKVKKEEKHKMQEPPAKKIKQEFAAFDNNPYSTFMVTCGTPEIAELIKEHIRKWRECKSVEWAQPGCAPLSNILEVIEDVAVLPPPYS